MDSYAGLTTDEASPFKFPDHTCEDATRNFAPKAGAVDSPQRFEREVTIFEASWKLKISLDAYEDLARIQPSWELLSILVNCEYKLYVLNQATPLRHNPFLSHWVEAIPRLAKTASQPEPKGPLRADGPIKTSEISTVRLELLKSLLRFNDPSQFAQQSPRQLFRDFVELRQAVSFEIGPYIQMLEEEGIYQRPSSPGPNADQEEVLGEDKHVDEEEDAEEEEEEEEENYEIQLAQASTGKALRHPKLSDFQQWKQDMLSRLESEPGTAIHELTHLPIGLSSLDFLTTLLQDQVLERFSIDPAPLISDYIQHALRLTEQMGQPPDSPSEGSFSGISMSGANGNIEDEIDHGREAQTRAVKLLLLFIRNLIRKALLPPEAIYFEIQEICVRYVWIKEVRDFRIFIEQGVGGEQANAQPV